MSQRDTTSREFERLAMPLLDSLYSFARWLTRDRDEAEDLVQETCAKAIRGFSGFTPGTNFRAWMFRILRNTFLNSRTALSAKMTVPLDEDAAPLPASIEHATPESLLLTQSNIEAMQRAIAAIPLHYREVLILCDVEELRYAEAAETLGIPIGTIMSRLSRARLTVRKVMEEERAGKRPAGRK